MAKISPTTMPYGKILPIEKFFGYPLQRWDDAIEADVSIVELYAHILAAYHDKPVEEYLNWTADAILDAVSLGGDEDPSTPSEPSK